MSGTWTKDDEELFAENNSISKDEAWKTWRTIDGTWKATQDFQMKIMQKQTLNVIKGFGWLHTILICLIFWRVW